MALDYPDLLPGVFAAGATNHEDIPDSDAATGRMAWDVGFPSETSQPLATGGVPPRRLDMNGFGNRISQHIFYQQSGALYAWDASLEYPVGAHVIGSDSKEYIAIAASGPDSAQGAVNPVADVNFTAWKSWQRSLVDIIYPVGSIYMSVNNVNPATLFGGVWQKIEGMFLLASSSSYALGSTGGSTSITLTANQMPVHNHTASAVNNTHSHSVKMPSQTISTTTAQSVKHTHSVTFPETTYTTSQAPAHTHGRGSLNISGTFFGASVNQNVNFPFSGAFSRAAGGVVFGGITSTAHDNYVTKFSAKDGWSGSLGSAGAHTHSLTIPETILTTASAGAHVHSVSVTVPEQTQATTSNTHTHNITINNAGGNAAVSIMPPYLAVNVWKRTA